MDAMQSPRPYAPLLDRLRQAGLRPTRQRLALARLLFATGDRHITAEQLHGEALAGTIRVSLATIYNGMFQFMVLQVICIGLVVYFPQIAMWFPQTLQTAARSQKIPEEHQKIIDRQKKNPQSLEDDDWGKQK